MAFLIQVLSTVSLLLPGLDLSNELWPIFTHILLSQGRMLKQTENHIIFCEKEPKDALTFMVKNPTIWCNPGTMQLYI